MPAIKGRRVAGLAPLDRQGIVHSNGNYSNLCDIIARRLLAIQKLGDAQSQCSWAPSPLWGEGGCLYEGGVGWTGVESKFAERVDGSANSARAL
jgi:hypothetical protein